MSRQLTLDDYLRHTMRNTRRFDHTTSIRAAQDNHARLSRHRELALRLHVEHPEGLTDFELAALSHVSQPSIGKRRLDLQREGWIEQTDLTRPAPSGSAARVWKITPAGIRAYEEMRGVPA